MTRSAGPLQTAPAEPRPTGLGARDFLAALFPEATPCESINLRVITPQGAVRSTFPRNHDDLLAAAAKAAPIANIYFGVNGRVNGDDSKDGVRRAYAVFADLDSPKTLRDDPVGRAEWKRAALTRLHELPLPPSAIVDSGGGFQAYWFLERPLQLPEPSDAYRGAEVARAERPLKGLVRLGADKAAAELARVLRLPGTLNHKSAYTDGPLPVTLVELHPDRRYAFEALLAAFPAPETEAPREPARVASPVPDNLDDAALLKIAFTARNGAAIEALWKGDTSAHGGDDSAADQALANHLAFYTGRDAARMERMFKQSELGTRAKWVERKDYRDRTIQTAIDGCREIYAPPSPRIVLKRARTDDPHAAEETQRDSSATPPVADETRLRFRTAREVGELTAAAVEWIARPWIAKGAITEIDGKIKSSGKTTFLLLLCRAVLDGVEFLGEPTRKGAVVYLSEQPPASLRQALARARLLDRDDFHVLSWADTIGASWPVVLALAVAKCAEVGAELLAVDTLPQFAGIKGDAENNAGAALEAMAPLQAIAARGAVGIACTRHERKAGGEVGDSARGSSAFGGAVDIVLQLKRAEGNARPTIRVIHGLSRFDGTPDTLAIELTEKGYVALGSESAIALHEAREALHAAVPPAEESAKTMAELLGETTGAKRTVAYEAAKQLVEEGALRQSGKGKRGDPHRYWRGTQRDNASEEIDSSVPRVEVADESFPPPEVGGTTTLGGVVVSPSRVITSNLNEDNRDTGSTRDRDTSSVDVDSSATSTLSTDELEAPASGSGNSNVIKVRV